MSKSEIITLAVVGYGVMIAVFTWLIGRGRPRDIGPAEDAEQMAALAAYWGQGLTDEIMGHGTRYGLTPPEAVSPATDTPAMPPEAITMGRHSPATSAAPPVMIKMVLLIERCPDPFMWYAGMIGKEVPYLGEFPSEKLFKSRESAGFINIVKYGDARIILKEPK